ncbi:MAG: lipid A biosynthesis acyltransferase, partial [Planctomycetaceae bacterium]|nr:lipid A biosynthesis acyltransferase [Planctomycetaceae bacterium]
MSWQEVRWRAEYLAFRLVAVVIDVLNVRQTKKLAEGMAWLLVYGLPRKWTRFHVAYANLETAFGDRRSPEELENIVYGMWVHLFRLVAEVIQFPRKVRLENCRDVITFRSRDQAVKAIGTGRPVFFLGGHFGNWEATTVTFGVFGFLMGIVARKLDNPYLHQWFVEARERTGHQLLLKHGGVDGMS